MLIYVQSLTFVGLDAQNLFFRLETIVLLIPSMALFKEYKALTQARPVPAIVDLRMSI